MASIKKTKTKAGDFKYRVRYRDPDGRSREKWFGKKADADRFRSRVDTELSRGDWVDPALASIRLSEWAEEWLATKMLRSRLRPECAQEIQPYHPIHHQDC